jgi:glycosyltransferase involved in cell wall biosynthesis
VSPGEPARLSVVMPVYNEEGAIVHALEEVQRHVLDQVPGSELVVVDDGSRDQTGRLLDDAASNDRRINVIHRPNGGHGAALLTGLKAATGEYLFLIDSDRQIPLDDFRHAWAELQAGPDAVFGVRKRRYDPAVRLYLSRLIRESVKVLFRVRLLDPNAPYKLFRRAVWSDAQECIPDGTLAPSLFLAIVAKRRGHRIVEVEVTHKERDTGEVTLRHFKLLAFCARALGQMIRLIRRVR